MEKIFANAAIFAMAFAVVMSQEVNKNMSSPVIVLKEEESNDCDLCAQWCAECKSRAFHLEVENSRLSKALEEAQKQLNYFRSKIKNNDHRDSAPLNTTTVSPSAPLLRELNSKTLQPTALPSPLPTPVPTANCGLGKYWSNTSQSCQNCSRGRYWNASLYTGIEFTTSCIDCPTGRYQPLTTQPSCWSCSKGRYQDEVGSVICKTCARGKYLGDKGATEENSCTICVAGKYALTTGSSSCAFCSEGKYIDDEASDADYHDSSEDCSACSSGKISSEDFSKCERCEAGKYSNLTTSVCQNCTVGKYAESTGSSECDTCVAGYFVDYPKGATQCSICTGSVGLTSKSGSTQCDFCEATYYYVPNEDGCDEETMVCGECIECDDLDESLTCRPGTTLDNIELSKGHWRAHATSKIIHECSNVADCVGGTNATGDEYSYCGDFNLGPYCRECREGYTRNSPEGECKLCNEDTLLEFTPQRILLLILAFMVAVIFLAGHVFAADLYSMMVIFSDTLEEIDDPEKPHGIYKRLVNKLKIICVCFQILCDLVVTLVMGQGIPFPDVIIDAAYSIGGAITINPSVIVPFGCIYHAEANSFRWRLIGLTLYPIALIIIILAYCQIKKGFAKDLSDKKSADARCLSLITLLLFVVLPATSKTVMNTFYYDSTDGGLTDDHIYLYIDYTTHVTDDNKVYWNLMVPYALIMIIVYPIGVPVFFLYLIKSKISHVDPVLYNPITKPATTRDQDDCALSDESFPAPSKSKGRRTIDETGIYRALAIRDADREIDHLSFLIDAYEPEFWYWEVVQTLYRVIIANVHIVQGKYEVALTFVCALIYWKIVSYFAPYTYDTDDALADVAQAVVVFMLFMTLLVQNLGCPYYFTYIFSGIAILPLAGMLLLALSDTKEEREFLWYERKTIMKKFREKTKKKSGKSVSSIARSHSRPSSRLEEDGFVPEDSTKTGIFKRNINESEL